MSSPANRHKSVRPFLSSGHRLPALVPRQPRVSTIVTIPDNEQQQPILHATINRRQPTTGGGIWFGSERHWSTSARGLGDKWVDTVPGRASSPLSFAFLGHSHHAAGLMLNLLVQGTPSVISSSHAAYSSPPPLIKISHSPAMPRPRGRSTTSVLMEGYLTIPPDRGTILGRALWKVRMA